MNECEGYEYHCIQVLKSLDKVHKKIRLLIGLGIMVSILLSGLLVSYAADSRETDGESKQEQTVKVGYIQLQGFLYKDEKGNYAGLAYELLEEIGVYNNWDYEFIETSYAESKEQLDNGTIDLFVPYQKTPERQELYEYSEEVFCSNNASLLTAPNKAMYFEDYASMNGITIGVAKGTRNGERFQELFESKGCQVYLKKDYLNQTELLEAMNKGEIDAFISASSRGIQNCKMIANLPETKSYATGKKGNRTYVDAVDDALHKISIDEPNFLNQLQEKYQVSEANTYPAITKQEEEYIDHKKEVTVLVSANECDKEGEFIGSAKMVFDKISEMTNLTFTPVIESDTSKIMSSFANGEADIVYSFNRDYQWAEQHRAWVTASYAEFYNQIITKQSANSDSIKKVAVVKGSYTEYYAEKNLDYELIGCSSYEDAIDMVYDEKVDGAICNSVIGDYYSTYPKYRDLSFMTSYELNNKYCIAVSKDQDIRLVGILNKSINCIPDNDLSKAFEEQMASRPVSISDVYYQNPVIAIAVAALIVATILTIMFLSLYVVTIRKKNRALNAATQAKSNFFARMSHDLRTPMNGILGMLELTKEEEDIGEIRSNLAKAELSGRYMLSLINDTLDLQRLEGGKVTLQPKIVKTGEYISSIVEMIYATAKKKGVHFEPHAQDNTNMDTYIRIDPVRVNQIFSNLVSNAIKFTPKGGTVNFDIFVEKREKNKVYDMIVIKDNGVGMSQEYIEHGIFRAYSQEQNQMTNQYAGSGLGLAIVKNLVDMMGATIEVESKLGVGTTFTIHIAFELVDEEEALAQMEEKAQAQQQQKETLGGKKILLCEDHPLNAEIAQKLLEKNGCTVDWAENGKIGLDKFRTSENGYYDAVLMDIRMPIMDGITAAKTIRQLEREDAKEVVIIAMTANAYETDIEASKAAGMNAHLAKPIDSKVLFATLSKYLVP